MAGRYRRFISGPLDYAQLVEIADDLTRRGLRASVTWDIFTDGGLSRTVHFLDLAECYCSVSTEGDIHFIQTGQAQPLDRIVDEALVALLARCPALRCTCSHCYSHTYDNSDLAGAWAPNPSESCAASAQKEVA